MQPFDHVSATSAAAAVELLQQGGPSGARVIAGGTDLISLMRDRIQSPRLLVNILPAAAALRYLRFEADGALRVGALATLADIERDPHIAARLPILTQAVRDAATPQLRAMATAAGNLMQRPRCWYYRGEFPCWLKGGDECFARDGENKYHAIFGASPCVAVHPSDLAPVLVALDAELTIAGPGGSARTLPVERFFAPPTDDERSEYRLQPGEVVSEIRVPAQPVGARGAYVKVMDRQAWAFALVSVAAQLSERDGVVERARLALGGVANVPWRVAAVEDLLTGQRLTPALAAQAAERALENAHPLTHNGYKVPMARAAIRRALLAAAGQEE
ncbi:MAG TPA: FAD binding domain-containing protein [Ktedonobacterales bacterium]|nr:FAD binding domain-containing protein [Ktedonobacterales bacterium]